MPDLLYGLENFFPTPFKSGLFLEVFEVIGNDAGTMNLEMPTIVGETSHSQAFLILCF